MQDNINIKFRNIYKPVDILIPYHEHYHILIECLESVIAKTLGITYTITLIDDCSRNKNIIPDFIKAKKWPIQYLRHDIQKGFGASLKTGFENTINEWIIFLHSDCRIEQSGWLINMQESMASHKKNGVKLVSAKVNDGGTGTYDENIIGNTEKRDDIITKNPLPLICTLAHRELFKKIGFIKEYPFGWYEDEHFYWNMKKHNYKQMVCGSSYVYHHGGATIKELLTNYKIRQIMEANQQKCIEDIRKVVK